jgi:drug/metabolite transporter (DMT)-like permease
LFDFVKNGAFVAIIAEGLIGISLVWDKVLLKNPGTKNLFSYVFWPGAMSAFGVILVPFGYQSPHAAVILIAFLAGVLHLAGVFFYYATLKRGEASETLAILGGFSPVATAAIAFLLLTKQMTSAQLLGFALMSGGGFVMFFSEKLPLKKLLPPMLLAAGLLGLVNVLEKLVYNRTNFVSGYVWFTIGTFAGAVSLLLPAPWRKQIFAESGQGRPRNRLWYFVNRFVSGVGSFLVFYAISLAHPAVVDAISGERYAVIFLGALLLTELKPDWLREGFRGWQLLTKTVATGLVVAGLVVVGLRGENKTHPLTVSEAAVLMYSRVSRNFPVREPGNGASGARRHRDWPSRSSIQVPHEERAGRKLMNGTNHFQYKRSLETLLNLKRSAWHNYIRAARSESFTWRDARKPFYHQLKAFFNTVVWVLTYLKYRFGMRHRFLDYSAHGVKGVYPLAPDFPLNGHSQLDEEIRVSLAGDWGTGTAEANLVANHIRRSRPHYTIHLGDIYFVGDSNAVLGNCLGDPQGKRIHAVTWPKGSRGSFALNGNHEMYANGNAYFNVLLPKLGMRPAPMLEAEGQKASFFALKNHHWIIVALDTGYNSVGVPILERTAYLKRIPHLGGDCSLPLPLLRWFAQEVQPELDGRGVILLSHHQYCSAFEGRFVKPGRQLSQFVRKSVLWFWGNEHRMAIYGPTRVERGIEAYGRCLGHGGMPISIHAKPRVNQKKCPLVFYDDRQCRRVSGTPVGYNGYANLIFRGRSLTIEYRDIREGDNLLLTETWEVRNGVLLGKDIRLESSDAGLIQSHPDLRFAIAPRPHRRPAQVLA